MLITLALSLVALAASFYSPVPGCSIVIARSVRPSGTLQMTLRATPEMMPDRRRVAPLPSASDRRWISPWDTATVFGQVFELVQVEVSPRAARLRGHQRVVLVWWTHGPGCQRMPPLPRPRQNVDELFLLVRPEAWDGAAANLRPDSLWIGGLPTFDLSAGAWTYSPQEPRPTNLDPSVQGVLTILEYRDYFAHLPLAGSSREAREASWRRLLEWAEADPRRWTLYPPAPELCAAVVNLQASAAWSHRCPP
jgi:hypothetical protein